MAIALKEVAYVTEAAAKGGRAGHVKSADGVIDVDLGKPGSTSNPKANPETLFAAGYAACFQGALTNRAATQDIDTSDSVVTAKVSFGPSEDGGFGLAVELEASAPGVEKEKMQELMALAHEFCPYSKATSGNINVTLTAV